MKYGWGGEWPEPTIADAAMAGAVRHACPQAIAAADLADNDDALHGIAFRNGQWILHDDDYYGYALPIRYCPYCGTDLTTIPTEGRALELVERRAG